MQSCEAEPQLIQLQHNSYNYRSGITVEGRAGRLYNLKEQKACCKIMSPSNVREIIPMVS